MTDPILSPLPPTAQAVVVGGGLAGSAAAVVLAQAGLQTVHLAPAGAPDRRTSALMLPSVDFLQNAGLVAEPAALGHALTQIRIIDATGRLIRAPETLFDAREAGLPAFGWNFANSRLLERFQEIAAGLPALQTIAQPVAAIARAGAGHRLSLADGRQLDAELLIGADGKNSSVRTYAGFATHQTPFTQSALVCDLTLTRPLGHTSVEFHYPQGPFTLVPAGSDRANLVWIDDAAVLAATKADPERLLRAIQHKSQHLFGAVTLASPAFVFPLSTLHVDRPGADGIVLVGEAAHAFPPIGAQGLNLGLRDVADLAAAIGHSPRSGDWALRASLDYARRRQLDLKRTGTMVDALFRSLLTDMLPAQALRAGGLWALKSLPVLRRQAFALGMGQR